MDMCLKGFRESREFKKDLTGFIHLNGRPLSDTDVRLIVNRGINEGYENLHAISDELAESWIREREIKQCETIRKEPKKRLSN